MAKNRLFALKIVIISLSLLCFSMVALVKILDKYGIMLNIQGFIPIDLVLFFFALGGLFAYIFLMFYNSALTRILFSIIAIAGIYGLFGLTALGSSSYTNIKTDNYAIIEKNNSFFFSGEYSFYLKENFLYSRYLDSCQWHDNKSCSYKINSGKLILTETYEGGKEVSITDLD